MLRTRAVILGNRSPGGLCDQWEGSIAVIASRRGIESAGDDAPDPLRRSFEWNVGDRQTFLGYLTRIEKQRFQLAILNR